MNSQERPFQCPCIRTSKCCLKVTLELGREVVENKCELKLQ